MDELVDGLVLLLIAAVIIGEAQHDHVATGVSQDGLPEITDDLLALHGQDKAPINLLKERKGDVDEVLIEKPLGSTVARGRVVALAPPVEHLANHLA